MTLDAAVRGLAAGLAGTAAMTLAEKVEQLLTGRPNSYVPAHTLARLLGLGDADADRLGRNWAMHWGQGIVLGAVRGLMAEGGVRGPFGSFLHMNLRLLNDQSFENATGAGAPPWTWPVDEQVVDLLHKGIYALVTGLVADRLVAGPLTEVRPRAGWTPAEQYAEVGVGPAATACTAPACGRSAATRSAVPVSPRFPARRS